MTTVYRRSPFIGLADQYGTVLKDPVPLRPLALNQVLENRPLSSASALFRLPTEILELIIGYVGWSTLACLALVNRDCRQLARSRQFADIFLDFSHASQALVSFLVSEAAERKENGGHTVLPSLGACIRRITVKTIIKNIRRRFDEEDPFHTQDRRIQWAATNRALDLYRRLLILVVGSTNTLPHLEILDWQDQDNLLPEFFTALASSATQHLKLYRPTISQEYGIVLPPSRASRGWHLRSLYLDLTVEWDLFSGVRSTRLCANMLRLCAPTLETLYWSGLRREDIQTFGDGHVPVFPNLRNLRFEALLHIGDKHMADAFLNSELVNLGVRTAAGIDQLREVLIQRGYMPSLSAFAMKSPPLQFLRSNTHLSKIDFASQGYTIEEIEQDVLPLLSIFPHLVSLRLFWPEDCISIPERGLELLGKLQSLKQLCISCGLTTGWQRTWLVDHGAVRRHLSPLKSLECLVLRGDTYPTELDFSSPGRYYEDTYATPEDIGFHAVPGARLGGVPIHAVGPMIDAKIGKPFWEEKHLKMVKSEAAKYMADFLELKRAYIGGCAISIRPHRRPVHVVPSDPITVTEEEWPYFENMFVEWVY